MSKIREKKAKTIDELEEIFSSCSIGIFTDYRGLTAADVADLRNNLRGSGIGFRVVKNTLARFAMEKMGREGLSRFFTGPVAVAFSHGDVIVPAKILNNYIREGKTTLEIKGGFLDDKALTAEDVMSLATLPPREVLIAKVVGGVQAPIVGLVSCLVAPMRGLMGVLQARIKQLEGE